MRRNRLQLRRARIEIIPMIDTIFFLLVFFMIASLSMMRMRAIAPAVPRPQTSVESLAGGAIPVVLTITGQRAYYIGREATDAGHLSADLTTQLRDHPGAPVVLNLAKTLPTQVLVDTLDRVADAHTASGDAPTTVIATEPTQ